MTILYVKDLSLDRDLTAPALAAVRGGNGNQANATDQSNFAAMLVPVAVGNGSTFSGGPVIFQVDSNPTQTLTNDSTSSNSKAFSLAGLLADF
jgi:hypothetical protein